jgi:hypothetical protein
LIYKTHFSCSKMVTSTEKSAFQIVQKVSH